MEQTQALKKIGANLKRIRLSRRLTQEELAEKLDIASHTIGFIEQGRRAPSFATVWKLSKALNTPVSSFFKGI